MWECFQYDAGDHTALSFLRPDEVLACAGIFPEAIIASAPSRDGALLSGWKPSKQFRELLQAVVASAGPDDPSLAAEAKGRHDTYLYIIDLRTPEGPHGRVPVEDIVGAFHVRDGRFTSADFEPMSGYLGFTRHGPPRLPPFLHEALLRTIRAMAAPRT